MRRLFVLLVGALVLGLGWASAALATDPGAIYLGRTTGCPYFYDPLNKSIAPQALLHSQKGEHCVQLSPPDVFWKSIPLNLPPNGGCNASLLVKERIPKGIDNYVIVVFSDVGNGTNFLYPPGQRRLQIESGLGSYSVPRGWVLYGLGGGSGAGSYTCADITKQDWLYAEAFGLSNRLAIAGTATDADGNAIANALVDIRGPTSASLRTDAAGRYSQLVKKGHYTVTIDFKSSGGQRFPLKSTQCAPGSGSTYSCDAQVQTKSVTADFRLSRPKLTIDFNPGVVPGDGRGASAVTLDLTIDGRPVDHQLLTAVATVAGFGGATAPTPPVFTSLTALAQYADKFSPPDGPDSQLDPPVLTCAGADLYGVGVLPLPGDVTYADGKLPFRLFVGTNATYPTNLTQDDVGPELRLTVTDIADSIPLPGLVQQSAILRLRSYTFSNSQPQAGITVPTPDGLRFLATHVSHPPNLSTSELANQVGLLNWLTEAVAHAQGRFPPFSPIDSGLPNSSSPRSFGIYFGPYDLGGLMLAPTLDTTQATAIFGSGPLAPALLPLQDSDLLAGLNLSPLYPANHFLFWGFGIYPDPTTSDGKQIEGCARVLLDTSNTERLPLPGL